jgi:FkbM family methyltransferase
MRTTENIADLTLHHLGRSGVRPSLVVIGAMDGHSFDDFSSYISLYEWSGLFVEPIPEQFRRLQQHYAGLEHAPQNKYENSAIADHDGTVRMLTINQAAVDSGAVHPCFGGMSAIYPPRNGLASAGDAEVVATYGELIEVDCLTLASLFARHGIERVDIVCIDAEGWDYAIIRQLDLSVYRPTLIRCEYINLTAEEQAAIEQQFVEHGYVVRIEGQNIDAVAVEFWEQDLRDARWHAAASTAAAAANPKPTLVTAVFDLSADSSDLGLRHRFGVYLDHVKQLLRIDWPMVVFTTPELEELVRRYRPRALTHCVHRSAADLAAFPFFDRIQEIRRGLDTAKGTRRGPAEAALPLYAPATLSKQFFLNDASIFDPFQSAMFLWVDSDLAAAIGDPAVWFTDECGRNLHALLRDQGMLYLVRPMTAEDDAPAFPRSAMAQFAGDLPRYQVETRVFGGSRAAINAVNGVYYSLLGRTLAAGCLGSEAHVSTLVAHAHPELCALHMVGGADGLRSWFEQLQHGVPDQVVER